MADPGSYTSDRHTFLTLNNTPQKTMRVKVREREKPLNKHIYNDLTRGDRGKQQLTRISINNKFRILLPSQLIEMQIY